MPKVNCENECHLQLGGIAEYFDWEHKMVFPLKGPWRRRFGTWVIARRLGNRLQIRDWVREDDGPELVRRGLWTWGIRMWRSGWWYPLSAVTAFSAAQPSVTFLFTLPSWVLRWAYACVGSGSIDKEWPGNKSEEWAKVAAWTLSFVSSLETGPFAPIPRPALERRDFCPHLNVGLVSVNPNFLS